MKPWWAKLKAGINRNNSKSPEKWEYRIGLSLSWDDVANIWNKLINKINERTKKNDK